MHYRIIKVIVPSDLHKKEHTDKAVIKIEDITAVVMLDSHAEVVINSGKAFKVSTKEGKKLFQKLVMMTEE